MSHKKAIKTYCDQNKNFWLHILIWSIAILYFFLSPTFHRHFLNNTNSQIVLDNLSAKITNEGKIYIDGLDSENISRSSKFKLWGWAFLTDDRYLSIDDYNRAIILFSDDEIYQYPVISTERLGVQDFFSDLNMDLINSGFYTYLTKETIKPGLYKIGMIFETKNGVAKLLWSSNYIEKTNNFISLK